MRNSTFQEVETRGSEVPGHLWLKIKETRESKQTMKALRPHPRPPEPDSGGGHSGMSPPQVIPVFAKDTMHKMAACFMHACVIPAKEPAHCEVVNK